MTPLKLDGIMLMCCNSFRVAGLLSDVSLG